MHHGDVCLLGSSVVMLVDDDLIDTSYLDLWGGDAAMGVEAQYSLPGAQMNVLPIGEITSVV